MATATFQEFLSELAREQGGPDVRARRKEWVEAVERLISQIRDWLRESDPDGVLEVRRRVFDRAEPGLGRYEVPGLEIGVGEATAEISPAGRNVRFTPNMLAVMANRSVNDPCDGRVDIGSPTHRWQLYRILHTGGGEQWWAVQRGETSGNARAILLSRETFEEVLRDVLS